jgi:mannose-6-phosphate isomerase-like protein (cupin superfamily)
MNRFTMLPLALALLVLAPAAGAQDQGAQPLPYQTGDPADWPPELDAVIAAPDNHTVLLENDQVRVLEVQMAPREVENLHHHRWPSVLYVMEAGHFIDRDANGEVIVDTREMEAFPPLPFTMWKDAEAPHSVENLSDSPIRLIRVELKQAGR